MQVQYSPSAVHQTHFREMASSSNKFGIRYPPAYPVTEQQRVPEFIFVLGPPGSGKSTLCTELAEKYKPICNLSVGDYLRKLSAMGEISEEAVKLMAEGELLPTDMILTLLRDKIDKEMKSIEGGDFPYFIIDGFPRNKEQLLEFETQVGKPALVLLCICTQNISSRRISKRHGREATDTPDIFEKRYEEFKQNNPEIIDHYKKPGVLLELERIARRRRLWPTFMSLWRRTTGGKQF